MSKYKRATKERERRDYYYERVVCILQVLLVYNRERENHCELPKIPSVSVLTNGSDWMRQRSILGNLLNCFSMKTTPSFKGKSLICPPCFLVSRVAVMFRQVTSVR